MQIPNLILYRSMLAFDVRQHYLAANKFARFARETARRAECSLQHHCCCRDAADAVASLAQSTPTQYAKVSVYPVLCDRQSNSKCWQRKEKYKLSTSGTSESPETQSSINSGIRTRAFIQLYLRSTKAFDSSLPHGSE